MVIDQVFILAHPAPDGRSLKVGMFSLYFSGKKVVIFNLLYIFNIAYLYIVSFIRKKTRKSFLRPNFNKLRWLFLSVYFFFTVYILVSPFFLFFGNVPMYEEFLLCGFSVPSLYFLSLLKSCQKIGSIIRHHFLQWVLWWMFFWV